MPLNYDLPPSHGAYRQGEILAGLWEHRTWYPAAKVEEGAEIPIESLEHPLVIVLTADCDIEHDFDSRAARDQPGRARESLIADYSAPPLIPYLLMCDLYN